MPAHPRARIVAAVLVAVALVAAGCRSGGGAGDAQRLSWRQVRLPATSGRVVARDLLRCGDRWYLVGAVAGAGGNRPAAWSSVDGVGWSAVPVAPVTYYGQRHILYAAGCRDGRLGALGAAPGGAHGNPRTSSWYQRPDGTLTEVQAAFELYGGPNAVAVSRIAGSPTSTPTGTPSATPSDASTGAASPGRSGATGSGGLDGWVIAGGWLADGGRVGAAAWWATGGAGAPAFQRVSGPPLGSGPDRQTAAQDVAAMPTGGFLMVGSVLLFGTGAATSAPMAWYSPDGRRWTAITVENPGHDGNPGRDGALYRLATGTAGAFALGTRGTALTGWQLDPTGGRLWRSAGTLPAHPGDATTPVQSFGTAGRALAATVVDRGHLTLWLSTTSPAPPNTAPPHTAPPNAGRPTGGRGWHRATIPADLTATEEHHLLAALSPTALLLAADTGTGTRLWLAHLPTG
jgi:hypothetical protein